MFVYKRKIFLIFKDIQEKSQDRAPNMSLLRRRASPFIPAKLPPPNRQSGQMPLWALIGDLFPPPGTSKFITSQTWSMPSEFHRRRNSGKGQISPSSSYLCKIISSWDTSTCCQLLPTSHHQLSSGGLNLSLTLTLTPSLFQTVTKELRLPLL